jgi:predicted dehydrogenase
MEAEMKIGLIGNRGHQQYVFESLHQLPEVQITAIVSGSEEDDIGEIKTWCEKEGYSPVVYDDTDELLADSGIEVVSIAGPFELHSQMSIQAFKNGIHVFCEKPVALNLEELDLLHSEYQQGNVHFSAMMGLRYDPAFYTAWSAVRRGEIGQVRLIYAQKSYKLGTRPEYYSRRSTYGGTIPWVGSHAVDWVYWFSHAQFVSVTASHSRLFNSGYGDLEVSAMCHFVLQDEIFASVSLDYYRPETARTHGDDRVRVVGTQGVIEVRGGKVYLISDLLKQEQKIPAACDRMLFADFIHQVEGKSRSLLSAEDVFTVTEACLLARQSADESKPLYFGRYE